jgi:hypothetical protein
LIADLEVWFAWVEAQQNNLTPLPAVSIEMCTTETIRRLYCDGEFEAGQNLGVHKKVVFNTKTRLQEILGKMRFLVERYVAANTPRERNPVECVRGFSLGLFQAIDWRIGFLKRVQLLFRDPLYPKFPVR